MKSFEDHFSAQSEEYARYRPRYPDELFAYLASLAPGRRLAWDCGTGSGQAAVDLARRFDRVVATDASPDQIAHAATHARIEYRVEPAEEAGLEPGSVDLVTVANAAHWFDLPKFYQVVRRVAAVDGILAVWMYHLPVIDPAIDRILFRYYKEVLGDYWPERIHYLDERYRTLPFPFIELDPPQFEARAEWDLHQLTGFLESWSAAQRYRAEHKHNATRVVWPELLESWGDAQRRRPIQWPLYLRVGRVS